MNKLKLVGDIIFGSLFIVTLFCGVYVMVIVIYEFPGIRIDGVFFGLSFGVISLIISILIFKNFKNLHNKLEIAFNKAASRYSTKN